MASTADAQPATDAKQPAPVNTTEGAQPKPTETSTAATDQPTTTNTPVDPVASLTSMWTSWMAPSTTTPATTHPAEQSQPDSENTEKAPSAGTDWLADAGKMFESAVADVSVKLKEATNSVDTKAIGEQVELMKQKSSRFVEDVSRSVQSIQLTPEEISKRASVITTSTRAALEHAGQSFERSRKEALEIFVDGGGKETDQLKVAPWDFAALPQNERPYADALRQEMLKIVVDAIYSKKKREHLFLSPDEQRQQFKFAFAANAGMAMAALDADKNMRRLRAGLVPGKMSEDSFWTVYFYHVHRVRQTLVANQGVMPEQDHEGEDDEDPATLFADDGEDEELAAFDTPVKDKEATETVVPKDKDGKRNWDDEIDAIFDDE